MMYLRRIRVQAARHRKLPRRALALQIAVVGGRELVTVHQLAEVLAVDLGVT